LGQAFLDLFFADLRLLERRVKAWREQAKQSARFIDELQRLLQVVKLSAGTLVKDDFGHDWTPR
jgi:hypothetical protein